MTLEELLARVLREPVAKLTEDVGPRTLKSWDSLQHLELITAVEKQYNVRFTAAEILSIDSVGKMRQILLQKGCDCPVRPSAR
jgi:acyl carrier protein